MILESFKYCLTKINIAQKINSDIKKKKLKFRSFCKMIDETFGLFNIFLGGRNE